MKTTSGRKATRRAPGSGRTSEIRSSVPRSAGSGVRYSTPCGSVHRSAIRGRAGRRKPSLEIQKRSTAHMWTLS